jgi:S1-C subfamily serine protease
VDTDTKINVFAASAILLFGALLGGVLTYQQMDSRFDSLQESINDSKTVIYTDSASRSYSELFQAIDQSVVSVTSRGDTSAQGSGFVYDDSGHIVTNEHVIDGASNIRVTFTDGKTYNARKVGEDPNNDLAVLKVNRRNLQPLELGNLSDVRVGDPAVAVGNPFGLRGTMTLGIISQKGRMLPTETGFSITNVLQTDAAVNPGNSGGPLLNREGEVVGVNTAIESRTGAFSGIGFAIPVNSVKNVVPQLINDDEDFDYPWIGVSGFDVTPPIADAMNLSESSGFLVVDVVEDGPADEAGIQGSNSTVEINGFNRSVGGDVIREINDEKMTGIGDIHLYLQAREVGETVNMTVVRDGEEISVPLTLGSREESRDDNGE